MGGAVGLIGSKMNVLKHISNLVHQILMKLSGNVLGMKRMKTDEFGHMFAHSCPGICPSFRPKLGHFYLFQYILNLVHQILMKLSGKVLGLKRMKTDEFGHMFAHSCPGMPII